MKLGVHTENDYIARTARVSTTDRLKSTVVRAVCDIQFDTAEVRFGQPNSHRPYLYLSGNVVEAHGDFPCGVSHIVFRDSNDDTRMSFRLEFTKEEIKSLVDKGLYDVPEGEFKCPDVFTEERFTFGDDDGNIGIDLKCSYIEPETDDDAPIFFVGVVDPNREAFADDTGYTDPALSAYFDEFKSPWFENMSSPESRYDVIRANEIEQPVEEDEESYAESYATDYDESDDYSGEEYDDYTDDDTAYDESEDEYNAADDDFAVQMKRIVQYVDEATGEASASGDDDDFDDEDYEYEFDDDEFSDGSEDDDDVSVGRKPIPDIDAKTNTRESQFGE